MSKGLYQFHWDCGRMGEVNGLFITTQEQVDKVVGNDVHFGEILGKHSDVYGTVEANEIKKLDVSSGVCDVLEKAVGRATISGYNPIDTYNEWLEDNKEEEEDDE